MVWKWLCFVLCGFDVLAFCLYGLDKYRAVRHKRRISEAVLLEFGFFGGAAGSLLGMFLFRHKTRHWYFWLVNGAGLMWQIVLIVWMRHNGF